MNKVIPHILLASLTFSFAGVALADTAVNANATVNVQVSASTTKQSQKPEARGANASTTTGIKEQIRENLKKRAENKLDKLTARYDATYQREVSILARINSRISKVKAAGGTTTASEKFAASAQVHLTEANTAILNLKALVDKVSAQSTASTTLSLTRDSVLALKAATGEAQKHLRAAHADMVSAISNLKGESTIHASSTSSTKATTTTKVENNNQ